MKQKDGTSEVENPQLIAGRPPEPSGWRRALPIVAFVGIGVLLGVATLGSDLGLTRSTGQTDARAGQTSDRSASGVGVGSRDVDPANKPRREYVASAMDLDRLRELASAGVSPLVEFRAGRREWLQTAVKLEDLDWVAKKRISCGRQFAAGMSDVCTYRLEVVVEPTDVEEGTVVYSRAVIPGEETGEAEPACVEFARCTAGARLSTRMPIPPGTKDPFGVRHNLSSSKPPAEWLDPDQLEKEAASADEAARWNEQYATDVDTDYRISTLSNLAKYLRNKAVELRNEPAT